MLGSQHGLSWRRHKRKWIQPKIQPKDTKAERADTESQPTKKRKSASKGKARKSKKWICCFFWGIIPWPFWLDFNLDVAHVPMSQLVCFSVSVVCSSQHCQKNKKQLLGITMADWDTLWAYSVLTYECWIDWPASSQVEKTPGLVDLHLRVCNQQWLRWWGLWWKAAVCAQRGAGYLLWQSVHSSLLWAS